MQPFNDIWNLALEELTKKYGKIVSDLWFTSLTLYEFTDTHAVVVCDMPYKYTILKNKYIDSIAEALAKVTGFAVEIIIVDKTIDPAEYAKYVNSIIGEVREPVNLADQDYIPQIIRFDVRRGRTKVIFRPGTAPGKDGRLYYTDRDGKLIPDSDVSSEAASFRSVIEYKGNLYFGSIGSSMLQLIRIDAQDHAEVVYQSLGRASSLRACAVHDPGDGEQLFFGGQDGNYLPWQQYQKSHPNERAPQPIVIRSLDPETAGTDHEDWSSIVADFRDFGKYSFSTVYISGGGNVWDLCSYNGRLYLVLACDGGWALFRGEKGGSSPNSFGWTWTEIVGDNGRYPLAMDSRIAGLNLQYARDYGCSNYAAALTGTGSWNPPRPRMSTTGKCILGPLITPPAFKARRSSKRWSASGP